MTAGLSLHQIKKLFGKKQKECSSQFKYTGQVRHLYAQLEAHKAGGRSSIDFCLCLAIALAAELPTQTKVYATSYQQRIW